VLLVKYARKRAGRGRCARGCRALIDSIGRSLPTAKPVGPKKRFARSLGAARSPSSARARVVGPTRGSTVAAVVTRSVFAPGLEERWLFAAGIAGNSPACARSAPRLAGGGARELTGPSAGAKIGPIRVEAIFSRYVGLRRRRASSASVFENSGPACSAAASVWSEVAHSAALAQQRRVGVALHGAIGPRFTLRIGVGSLP